MANQEGAGRHTALVTGANRGIGLEVCRQLGRRGLRIVLAGREDGAVAEAAAVLRAAGLHVDVLVNNAGIYPPGTLLETPPGIFREVIETNFMGAVWTCRAFVPAMLAAGYGRVVNVSSGYGSFGEGLEGPAAYSLSKAALDALTLKLASEVRGDVKVNAVCPGWVRTRMGGSGARRPVEKGADTIVWLATLPADGPNGGLFRDRQRIPW